MRLKASAALLLPILLLSACSDGGTQRNDPAAGNDSGLAGPGAPGNEAVPPGEPTAPQQRGNGTVAPEPSGDVTLSAAPATASAGATMTLTLRNAAREPVGYNLCTSAIETAGGRPVTSDRVCTMELRTLNSGASADYSYELPSGISDGTYRFVTQVELMDSGRRSGVRSNTFQVR